MTTKESLSAQPAQEDTPCASAVSHAGTAPEERVTSSAHLTLEERITRLEDIEAIRMLQAKYQRCLDMHDFEGVAQCFAPHAVAAYDSGTMAYQGRDAIIAFLSRTLTSRIQSSHLIHGGEIDFSDAQHATGIWYLEDYLLHRTFLLKMHGAAVYHNEYEKDSDGIWHISKIAYDRNYEYFERRTLLNLLTLAKRSILQQKLQ